MFLRQALNTQATQSPVRLGCYSSHLLEKNEHASLSQSNHISDEEKKIDVLTTEIGIGHFCLEGIIVNLLSETIFSLKNKRL